MQPKKSIPISLVPFCAFIFLIVTTGLSQSGGGIRGIITDADNNNELPGATIQIKGTQIGTISDAFGTYFLPLNAGNHIIEVRYLGFQTIEQEVNITEEIQSVDFEITGELSLMGEIVITAQQVGQAAAINQQITANTIVNVVSQDKIRELPDQNAAETVGRLPGISVQRSGGEGQKIVVRGLSPRFSSITINGERIPASDNDRSVDLSMMSTDVLAGIEVFKSQTPDRDADAVGGTVNFITKRASDAPKLTGYMQYGYNAQAQEWGQIRGSVSGSKRFFDNKLGIIVTGNYQKANRNEDIDQRDWALGDIINGERVVNLSGVNLRRHFQDRFRFGGATTLDYQLGPKSRITANSLLQFRKDEADFYRTSYSIIDVNYRLTSRESTERIIANSLIGEHQVFRNWKLDWRASYNLNKDDRPLDHTIRFVDQGGSDGVENTPEAMIERATTVLHRLEETRLSRVENTTRDRRTQNITANFDLTIPVSISEKVSGSVKFGSKFRQDARDSDETQFWIVGMENSNFDYSFLDPEQYIRFAGGDNVIINSFLTPISQTNYLVSPFPFGVGASDTLQGYHLSRAEVLNFFNQNFDEYDLNVQADFDDYEVVDRITSGYVMGTLNFGGLVTLVGGVRAENTYLKYTGRIGSAADPDDDMDGGSAQNDTTRTRSYLEFFPQINVKIQPHEWFDIRLAATKTINRPNFLDLVPWSRLDQFNKRLDRGNFDLQHTTAWNYDLFLSFYNKIGLFTVGGFYKELTDIDYNSKSRFEDEFGTNLDLFEPRNVSQTTTLQGVEIEAQMNFRFLPAPFDGILLSANATFLESTSQYPFLEVLRLPTRTVETVREAPLIRQPNSIFNISIGYEKGGFTGRISMVHQGKVISNVADEPAADQFEDETTRFDLTFKQAVNKYLKLYINFNNITNQPEVERFNTRMRSTSEFGATADFGIQLRLK